MKREVVLDTETTGLDPIKGDRIIEIGAVELLDHIPTGNNFHVYINPERKIPEKSIEIHKITDDFISDKPLFKDIVKDFLCFIENSTLVIHNAVFDLSFLNFELNKCGFSEMERPVIDTLILAKERYPGSRVSLDALCRKFNIDTSERDLKGHGALTDTILLSKVYFELLGGKQPNLSFNNEKELKIETEENNSKIYMERSKPLDSRLSHADLEKHRAYVKSIGCEKIWKSVEIY